jgi:hypothetical protein
MNPIDKSGRGNGKNIIYKEISHYICNYALASTGIDLRSFHQSTLYIVYIDISHYICNYACLIP